MESKGSQLKHCQRQKFIELEKMWLLWNSKYTPYRLCIFSPGVDHCWGVNQLLGVAPKWPFSWINKAFFCRFFLIKKCESVEKVQKYDFNQQTVSQNTQQPTTALLKRVFIVVYFDQRTQACAYGSHGREQWKTLENDLKNSIF